MRGIAALFHRAGSWRGPALVSGLLAILAGCSTPPPKPNRPPVPDLPPTATEPEAAPQPAKVSMATNPRDYRRDAASHLYALNAARIYLGKLPPMLYAVGVLQVDIDRNGEVRDIRWMRAPTQAPEVIAEIERSVRAAAPFPAPVKMGRVTYTDTWLWHKSGQFQLDTLTEGQL